jgi:ubiquitin carboxyl-terminal hydrolase 7
MDTVRNNMAARANDLRLYLDYNPDHAKFNSLHADPSNPPIMIFLKFFDVNRQQMLGQGKVFVHKSQKCSDLLAIIQERMGWTNTVPIKLYEEIKAGMIEGLKLKQTFAQNEIQDGDVIAFQVEKSEKE